MGEESECKPASEIDAKGASAAGDAIEALIREDFCVAKGGCQFLPAGVPTISSDFMDMRSGGSQQNFVSWLVLNNPRVNEGALQLAAASKDLLPVPDLATHQKIRREFYEIKPNSKKGIGNGQRKISKLVPLFGTHGLSYIPGVIYSPNRRQPISITRTPLYEIEVSVRWFRLEAGLIVYDICTKTKIRMRMSKRAEDAIQKAAIYLMVATVILLAGGAILVA